MGNAIKKEMVYAQIEDLKSICANNKYSDTILDNISALLSETTDRLNCLTLGERMNGIYLTEKQYEQLLECKYMYEDLCK